MKTFVRFFTAFILVFSVSSAFSQIRQTHLYIDDGTGHFTVLSGASGGGTVTFPAGGGTIAVNGGNLVVSTETDTAKSANTVTVTATTSAATIVNSGSTADVTVSASAGTPGQVLYIFNDLGTTHNVTLSSYMIADGKIGIFIYLGGGWRALAPTGTI